MEGFSAWKDKKFMRVDEKAVARAQSLIDDDIAVGRRKELIEKVIGWHKEKGFLTKGQRKLLKNLNEEYSDFAFEQELCARLVTAYNEDKTPPMAETFIRSVVEQFRERHSFTDLQREQIIKIVDGANPTVDFDDAALYEDVEITEEKD